MQHRVFLTSLIGAVTLAAQATAASGGEAIALAPVQLPPSLAADGEQMVTAVIRGLGASGRTVLEARRTATELDGCTTTECLARLGRRVEATYVVSAKLWESTSVQGFSLQFQLIDSASERLLNTETGECDTRNDPVAECARLLAKELVRHALTKPDQTKDAGATAAAPSGNARPGGAENPPGGRGAAPRQSVVLPLAAMGAGAVTAIAGIWLIAVDGDGVDCRETPGGPQCVSLRDTGGLGTGVAIAGGLAIAGGTAWLISRLGLWSSSRVQVSASRDGIQVLGAF